MSHIFISYSHKDKEYVHKLHDALQNEGFDVWIDDRIDYGDKWLKVIEKNLDECDAFIIVMSKNSSESEMVQNEITRARDLEKQIFPLLLDGKNWLVVQSKQFVDVRDGSLPTEKFYRRLETVTQRRSKNYELEVNEKVAREQAILEISQKARLEKELDRQKAAEEKTKKEAQREAESRIKKVKRDLQWERFRLHLRYRLDVLWGYRIPTLFIVMALAIAVPLLMDLSNKAPEFGQTLDLTSTATNTLTVQLFTPSKTLESNQKPTEFLTPTSTPTKIVISTDTPLPAGITDAKGVSMVLVPEGAFTMGYDANVAYDECQNAPRQFDFGSCQRWWFQDSHPPHQVNLETYYIDKFEVTNALYQDCVDVGFCKSPYELMSSSRSRYYSNPVFSNFPVVQVDWSMAVTYCEWRGARLPSEAEWEKAARGKNNSIYPWGNAFDGKLANLCDSNCAFDGSKNINDNDGYADTSPVGNYEGGKSFYDVYDMVGNVEEWVNDWYSNTYYSTLPDSTNNPLGPDGGTNRVVRGSSWRNTDGDNYSRYYRDPITGDYEVGFRCAKSVVP